METAPICTNSPREAVDTFIQALRRRRDRIRRRPEAIRPRPRRQGPD
jgi:hypothetical protein